MSIQFDDEKPKLRLNFEEKRPDDLIQKVITKTRNFEWKYEKFKYVNIINYKVAQRLLSLNLINDVYVETVDGVEEDKITIEYNFTCQLDRKDLIKAAQIVKEGNHVTNKYKIPRSFEIPLKYVCRKTLEYNCDSTVCPILLAGYIFHITKNLNKELPPPESTIKKEVIVEKRESIKEVITEDLAKRQSKILQEIQENMNIHKTIKEEFYRIVRTLDNYSKFRDKISNKPNMNIVFADNTDSISILTAGQEEYIKQYISILKHFQMIDENESEPKIIDFKEIKETDYLNEENYKNNRVIILKNIYTLSLKDTTEITNERQLNTSIIKSQFPSYILKNSNDKIFIICDKTVNVKNFYINYNQLKIMFNTLEIPHLKINEVYDILITKFKDKDLGLQLEENFEENLKNYIDKHYPYSSYQNMEFVRYLLNHAIENSFNTSQPGYIVTKYFHKFKTNQLEGEAALNELIGLDNVKEEIRDLKNFLEFTKEKEKLGEKMPKIDLHMCYLGNPGTGKTTVARMMADILFNLGYIRYNKCIETEAKDFISNIPGGTAIKTSETIQGALGGILFIDEAYALGQSPYGEECIATLIKTMEDFRDDLIVILAGYNDEMDTFLEINSGFKSRIAYYLNFKNYSTEELFQMFETQFAKYGFRIDSPETIRKINELCDQEKQKRSFGNGRFVRQKVEDILKQHAKNCIEETNEEIKNHIIRPNDILLY